MKVRPKDITHNRLYPIVMLERMLSHTWRHRLGAISIGVVALATVFLVIAYVNTIFPLVAGTSAIFLNVLIPYAGGLWFIMFALWISLFLLEAFYRSYYFKEREYVRAMGSAHDPIEFLSFETIRILAQARHDGDIVRALFDSRTGKRILLRCGIGSQDQAFFLRERSEPSVFDIEIDSTTQARLFTLSDLARSLVNRDNELNEFLFARGIKEQEFTGAAEWVIAENEDQKNAERWWVREYLRGIPSIARDWSYGHAFALEQYATAISGLRLGHSYEDRLVRQGTDIETLEQVLSRQREANALVVGDAGGGRLHLIELLAQRIRDGVTSPALEGKRVMLFDTERLIASTGDKHTFEATLIKILENTIKAGGNMVIVFENFTQFIESARALGSNIVTLIDKYLASSGLQIVALADRDSFHGSLEHNSWIMKRFEKILIEEPDMKTTIAMLQKTARRMEAQHHIMFTYPALETIVESADRYIVDGVMPDKAIDLLIEVVPVVTSRKQFFVRKEDIISLVRNKTHIPMGDIDTAEQETLSQLESILHKRVVGQDTAVKAVSNAMRRARAGVRNPDRPIGSFLFLGPTGVGKTETSKALAEAFFGDESYMMRLDMSEYQGIDAIGRLIGSRETGEAGALAKMIREHPYGVVLLDEFEKSNTDVHDLFLQVFDEGFFSDVYGKRVNARNIIFVATSNAGSDLIWEASQNGQKVADMKEQLIEELIGEQTFRPEFLNRFDAVVLFHPLGQEHIQRIARIALDRLARRLKERNVNFVVTDDLVNYVAGQEYRRSFGARPMNRFIQEHIEQYIAEKLISGELREGATVELHKEDLASVDE